MEEKFNKQVSQLVEITMQKAKHLETILQITRKQNESLNAGSFVQLSAFIDEKQTHIDAINNLDKAFDLLYSQFDEKSLNLVAALQPPVAMVQRLAEQIKLIERENYDMANKTMIDIKQKLKDLNKGKNGYNAYKRVSLAQDVKIFDKTK